MALLKSDSYIYKKIKIRICDFHLFEATASVTSDPEQGWGLTQSKPTYSLSIAFSREKTPVRIKLKDRINLPETSDKVPQRGSGCAQRCSDERSDVISIYQRVKQFLFGSTTPITVER